MHVAIVHVAVKADHVEDFLAATRANHEASVLEPECLRFDVLQSAEDPCRFVLYEAYASERGAQDHKLTAHYRRWRDTVAPWMAEPRRGVVYKGLCPSPACP